MDWDAIWGFQADNNRADHHYRNSPQQHIRTLLVFPKARKQMWLGWEKTERDVQAFFKQASPCLWIHGPVGTGKTSLVKRIAAAHGINATPFRHVEQFLPFTVASARGVLLIDDVPSAIALYPEFKKKLFSCVTDKAKGRFFFSSTTEQFYQFKKTWPAHFFAYTTRTYKPFPSAIQRGLNCSWAIAQACHGDVRKAKLLMLCGGATADVRVSAIESAETVLGLRPGPVVAHDSLTHAWAFDNYVHQEGSLEGVWEFADRFSEMDASHYFTAAALKRPCRKTPRPRRRMARVRPSRVKRAPVRDLGLRLVPSTFGMPLPDVWACLHTFDRAVLRTLKSREQQTLFLRRTDFTSADRLLLQHAFEEVEGEKNR